MDDFGRFCYLDVQKTGSTFVTAVLTAGCRLPLLKSEKHRAIREASGKANGPGVFRDDTFYFNSIRNPKSYYVSLYNYGCDGRGGLFSRIAASGHAGLYGGSERDFHRWLDFMLDENKAGLFDKEYESVCGSGIGLVTFRFLRLSMAEPQKYLAQAKSYPEIERIFGARNIAHSTMRNETLVADLRQIIFAQLPEFFDLDAAESALNSGWINSSRSGAVAVAAIDAYPNRDILLQKERLVIERFYA